jgi:pyruvate formate lyase activating enzyme
MRAPINKIIDFSTVDGPGNRTSIFFQGCNIHCAYCHNPETQKLCINCGECIKTCPSKALSMKDGKVFWDEEKCSSCDTCINVCTHRASPKIKYLTPEEVFNVVKGNEPFIRGITVSGGECSLYPDFLKELFILAKKDNLTTLMDSNGMILYENYPELMKVVDGVMLDIKSWDNDIYNHLVGFDNANVKRNLQYLVDNNKIEELRIVYVPSLVDAKNCIEGIASILKEKTKSTKLKLITFRKNGVRGQLENHSSPSGDEMNELKDFALKKGFTKIELR